MRIDPWDDMDVDLVGPCLVYVKLLVADKTESKTISALISIDSS